MARGNPLIRQKWIQGTEVLTLRIFDWKLSVASVSFFLEFGVWSLLELSYAMALILFCITYLKILLSDNKQHPDFLLWINVLRQWVSIKC